MHAAGNYNDAVPFAIAVDRNASRFVYRIYDTIFIKRYTQMYLLNVIV